MTIASYSDLLTAVPNWLAKPTDTDITGNVADFIALAETDIRTDLNTSAMETFSSALSIAGEYVTLASISPQLTEVERLYLTNTSPYTPVHYRTPQADSSRFPRWDSRNPERLHHYLRAAAVPQGPRHHVHRAYHLSEVVRPRSPRPQPILS